MFSASARLGFFPQPLDVVGFHHDGSRHIVYEALAVLLFIAEERVEKPRRPRVEAELTMLEEDVNGFPERVIQDFNQLLVNERGRVDLHRVIAFLARQGKGHGAAASRLLERSSNAGIAPGGAKPITMSSARQMASSQGP